MLCTIYNTLGQFRKVLGSFGIFGSFGLGRPCVVEDPKIEYGHDEKRLWIYVWEFGSVSDPQELIFWVRRTLFMQEMEKLVI